MNSTRLCSARAYALKMHVNQMYGAHSYAFHLDMVAAALEPYGIEAQVIGYLHDVVEDTMATNADVRSCFGEQVAECVALLTDEPGTTRRERKSETYAKLAKVSGHAELALIVKVADRLSNVRACVADANLALWSLYHCEQTVFRQSAFRAGLCDELWFALDRLLGEDARPDAR